MPRILPHPALRSYVQHYLLLHIQLKGVPDHQRIKPIPPDADQSLYFYPRSATKTIVNSTGATRQSGSSIFVGQQTSRINLLFGEDHLVIQVCFRAGFLYQFLGKIPISTFQDKEINAEELSDSGLKELNEQLQEETDYRLMIGRIEAYLLKKIAIIATEIQPIDRAIVALRSARNPFSLDWFADQACLSHRQFERKFQERMGMSPKFYARIARFDSAFKLKTQNPQFNWLEVAYSCGYFDFSHLMRDFRQFAEVTPSLLIAQNIVSPDQQSIVD